MRLVPFAILLSLATLAGCGTSSQLPALPRSHKLAPPLIPVTKPAFPYRQGPWAGTTVGIAMCDQAATNRVNKRSNVLIKSIFARLAGVDRHTPQSGQFRGSARVRFIEAENAWLKHEKTMCASFGDVFAGGSVAVDLRSDCTLRASEEHLRQLRELACFGYGLDGEDACLRRVAAQGIDPYQSMRP